MGLPQVVVVGHRRQPAGGVLMRQTRGSSVVTMSAVAATAALACGPLALMAVMSVGRGWFWPKVLPPEWSLRAWVYLAAPSSGVAGAFLTSAVIAALVAVVAVALALPAARALALHRFPGRRLLTLGLLLPVLTPPLAAAMGLHAVFLSLGLTDSVAGVMLVHLVPAVPYATLMLAGTFTHFDTDLEGQARTLGASPRRVWTRVTLPALAPGIALATAFAFLISWSQYLLTLLVGGGQVITLPLLLVGFVRGGDDAVGAALSLVFIAPTLLVFGAVARLLRSH
jgi:putative spermidine/putrescine transport system permease protein